MKRMEMKKIINLPSKLYEKLSFNQPLYIETYKVISEFSEILKENNLFFFPEYTDHGIKHVEDTLFCIEEIIPEDSFDLIKPLDVSILLLSVVIHDIGMHTQFETFIKMLEGYYDKSLNCELDKKEWKEIWDEYLDDTKYYSRSKKEMIFGNPNLTIEFPDLLNYGKITQNDKILIGEFLRINHGRLAHEISLKGFIGNSIIKFGFEGREEQFLLDNSLLDIAGFIARSHNMDLREANDYLKTKYSDEYEWPKISEVQVTYLMILLRIADYLQLDKSRTTLTKLKLKTFSSPYSLSEHRSHLSIKNLKFDSQIPETLYVLCDPEDPRMFVKLETLFLNIQHEIDLSWVVLGETYRESNYPKLKFRRIKSNLKDKKKCDNFNYVPQKVTFKFSNDLSKLLIAPLYGDNPVFGVRELVQNATDACLERAKIEKLKNNNNYSPEVKVSIDKIEDSDDLIFQIEDNGKGMTLKEITDYFLTIGSSFQSSIEWKKFSEKNKTFRNGRFGIGVLSAFLIGDEITVETKSIKDKYKYSFKISLDTEFISIDRVVVDSEAGTKISIKISSHKKNISKWKIKEIYWIDWYIGRQCKVSYFIFNDELKNEAFKKDFITLDSDSVEFEKVKWIPNTIFDNNDLTPLIINDIIVTNNSCLKLFYLEKKNYPSFLRYPCLSIKDLHNNIPIKLDRTNIEEKFKFNFKKELFKEVVKDYIAQLLLLDLNLRFKKIYNFNLITPTFYHLNDIETLIFNKSGFCFDSYFFFKRKREDKDFFAKSIYLVDIEINPLNRNFYDFIKIDQDVFVIFGRATSINQENCIASFRQKTEFYLNPSFDDFKKELIVNDTSFYMYSTTPNYELYINEYNNICSNIIYESKDLNIFYQNVFHIEPSDNNLDRLDLMSLFESGILNEFDKHFNDNIFIPYDIKDRYNLFQNSFYDLKKYITYHIKDELSLNDDFAKGLNVFEIQKYNKRIKDLKFILKNISN